MDAQTLYLEFQKQPRAVSETLKAFGYNKPHPIMEDVLNAFIVHENNFADVLSKNLGYSFWTGNEIAGWLDKLVVAAKGVSVLGQAAKDAVKEPTPAEKAAAQKAKEPQKKILGIDATMFYVLCAVLALLVIVLAFNYAK